MNRAAVEKVIADARKDGSVPDLSRRDLHYLVLTGADLCGVDMRNTDLRGADLSGAALCGADLRYADLTNTKLTGIKRDGNTLGVPSAEGGAA